MGSEYQSCWCLGLGGRDQYTMGVRTDAGALAPMVKLPDGVMIGPFNGYREHCSCPEGEALARQETAQHHELGAAYRSLSTHRRAQHARIPTIYDGLDLQSWLDAIKEREPSLDIVAAAQVIGASIRDWMLASLNGKEGTPALLFMAGGYGNGKTGLASVIGRIFLDNKGTVTMRKVAELLAELRAAPWRSRGTGDEDRPLTEHELVVRASQDELLILDDLGAEALVGAQADRAVEALLLIIDGRLSTNKPTVITTNESGEVLKQRIGERLLDRLIGGRTSKLVVFNAIPSLRKAAW